MIDYISRDQAKDAFCDHCEWAERGAPRCETCEINMIPAADVRPVKRGTWEKEAIGEYGLEQYFWD